MLKRNSGFTLIELLVVIGIMAILASVVIVAIGPGKEQHDKYDECRQYLSARVSATPNDCLVVIGQLRDK